MILFADLGCGADENRLLSALVDIADKTGRLPFRTLQGLLAGAFPDIRATLMHQNTANPPAAHIQTRVMPSPATPAIDALDVDDGVKAHIGSVVERMSRAGACAPTRDALYAIAGVAVLLDRLDVEQVYITPLALGGLLATDDDIPPEAQGISERRASIAQILSAAKTPLPFVTGPLPAELCTPAGAALMAEYATSSEPLPPSTPCACGYGVGNHSQQDGNDVIRLILCEDATGSELTIDQVCLLESNIDHISAEAIAFCADELLKKGALDVWQEAITMKKGRLGTLLSALCRPSDADRLCDVIHASTGTLGIRRRLIVRSVMERREYVFPTPYGDVRFKAGVPHDHAGDDSENRWLRAESDDIARIAHETGRGYDAVKKELFGQATAQIQIQRTGDR